MIANGTQWGLWRFQKENLTLQLDGPQWYEIDLERIHNSPEMLDWIFQVASKRWADATMVGDLCFALLALFDPQNNLCSFGIDKKINPVDLLTRKPI